MNKKMKSLQKLLPTLLILGILGGLFLRFNQQNFNQQTQNAPQNADVAQISTESRVKPTPLTPIPTIPPKPSPTGSSIKPTPLTPIPTIPPKPSPTATAPPSSTPTQTQTVVSVPPEDLPAGQKVVFAETDGPAGMTTIWLASATSPELRSILGTVTHQANRRVQGAVSPDQSKVAYHIIPPKTSINAARTDGGELWIMDLSNGNTDKVADKVGYFINWSFDSKLLTFGRLTPIQTPQNRDMSLKTELYFVTVDGLEQSLFLTDESVYGIYPLGWHPNKEILYYLFTSAPEQREIWSVDILSQIKEYQISLPAADIIRDISLSPDGTKVLLNIWHQGQKSIQILDFDDQAEQLFASKMLDAQPINQYTAIWTANSQNILIYVPSHNNLTSQFEYANLETNENHIINLERLPEDEFYIPHTSSPDNEWLVFVKYPYNSSQMYLRSTTSETIKQIILTKPSNWIYLLGWID